MTGAITGLKRPRLAIPFNSENNHHEMNTKTGDARVGYEWIALSVTTIGVLMASIDGSAVIIALPTILADLQASFITMMWVLLAYLLIVAAIVPVVGRLADILGRKNLYNIGFVIFTFGSLLCGLSLPQFHGVDLLVYRMIQGVGGALLMTNSVVIVTDAFRKG
ncbi:MAG: MFS transporter, partial [Halobacteriota archaeon]